MVGKNNLEEHHRSSLGPTFIINRTNDIIHIRNRQIPAFLNIYNFNGTYLEHATVNNGEYL